MAARAPNILDQTPARKYEAIMDDLLWYMESVYGPTDVKAVRLTLAAVYSHVFEPEPLLPVYSKNFPPQLLESTGDTKFMQCYAEYCPELFRPGKTVNHVIRIRFRIQPAPGTEVSDEQQAGLRLRIHNLIDPDFRDRTHPTRAAEPDINALTAMRVLKAIRRKNGHKETFLPLGLLDRALRIATAHAAMMGKTQPDAEEKTLVSKVLIDSLTNGQRDIIKFIPDGEFFTVESLKKSFRFRNDGKKGPDGFRIARARKRTVMIIEMLMRANLIVDAPALFVLEQPEPLADRKQSSGVNPRFDSLLAAAPRFRRLLRTGGFN